MTQHNPNLSLNQQGKDVSLLHSRLINMGYTIDTSEIIEELFGQSTYQAVLSFQHLEGLPTNGVVDEVTTRAIVSRLESEKTMMMPGPQPIQHQAASPSSGTASQEPGKPVEVVRGAALPQPQTPEPSPTPPQSPPGVPPGGSTQRIIEEQSSQISGGMPQQSAQSGSPSVTTIPSPAGARPPFGVPGSPPLPVGHGLWVVQGHVHLSDGSPLPGVTVQALKAVVGRDPTPIAQAHASTDADGAYAIHYAANNFAETRAAALIVRALTHEGNALATSPMLPHLGEVITEDLVVSTGAAGIPSEYERLVNVVGPQLAEVDVLDTRSPSLVQKLADLKPVDLDLLAQVPGLERARLQLLSGAAGLQEQAQGLGIEVPAPAFYGLAREGMPLDPIGLFNRGIPAIQDAFQRALKDNVIPPASAGTVGAAMGAIQRFVVEVTLRTPPAQGLQPIGDLLGLLLTTDQQITFLTLQASNKDSPQQFWTTLSQQPGFQAPGLVNNLQVNEQLHQLTLGNIALVVALRQSYNFSSPRELVRLTQTQWIELINKKINGKPVGLPPGVPGTTPQDQVNGYVATIMGTLQKQYPTDAAVQIIAETSNLHMGPRTRQGVLQFFTNSPTFDLLHTHVDQYLAANKDTALKGIAEDDQADVVTQVKRVQRLYRLSDSPEQMTILLGTRFDSARAIATTPRATFVQQMKDQLGGESAANQVYRKAQSVQALVLHIATTLYQEAYGVRPRVLGETGPTSARSGQTSGASGGDGAGSVNTGSNTGRGSGATMQSLIESIPTLADLFGSLDTCACNECRSVLGPSAYLVDLLQLLGNTPAQPKMSAGAPWMQDILFSRRPDIPLINLTCENADTPLPYIDLVNEILETYVAVYSAYYQTPQSAPINVSMFTAQIGSQATFAPTGNNSGTNDTGDATPDELLASPQYLVDAAYTELQGAIYPFTLPFDQFLETARVYLQSQGSSLYQAMQTFQPDGVTVGAPYTSVSQRLNGEYLKLAPAEYRLLSGHRQFTDPITNQQIAATVSDYYGYTLHLGHPGNTAVTSGDVTKLSTVCEFLDRTGLTLDELIHVLRMRTVNPNYAVIPVLEGLGLDYVEMWKTEPSGFTNLSHDILNALRAAQVSPKDFSTWMTQPPYGQTNVPSPGQALGNVIVIDQQTVTGANGIVTVQCDTYKMALRHVDGTDLTDGERLWLYFFIRLWRKLGWAMEDLDNALANWLLSWPWTTQTVDLTVPLDRLSQVAQLHDTLNVPVADLLPLWVDFTGDGTTVKNEGLCPISPRYQQLFLNRAARKIDPVFRPTWQGIAPNPQDPTTTLHNQPSSLDSHIFAIVAAFRITESELTAIREQTGLSATSQSVVPLNMQTLSTIYRRVLLARALKLSIPDLFSLIALSGLDPFADPGTTLQFVQLAQTVKRSGFTVAQLNYLFRDLDTTSAGQAPKGDDILQLAIQLRAGLNSIVSQTQEVADPTGAVLQTMLGKIFDTPTVAQAMHMLDGTQVYTAPLTPASHVNAPSLFVPQDLQSRVSYVAGQGNKPGRLRVRGPLSDADKNELLNPHLPNDPNTPNPNFTEFTDYSPAVTAVWQQPQDFIASAFAGFLTTAQDQTDALSNLLLIGQLPSAVPTTADKYQYVLHRFLPFLRDRLCRLFVKQTLATALKLDPAVAAALLENVSVLHSRTNGTDPAVADALALTTPGLTANCEYLAVSISSSSGPLQTIDASALPQGTVSVTYTGSVTAPSAGAYAFAVTTTPGAMVQFALADQGAPVASFSSLAPLSSGVVSFPSCTLAANHTYDLTLAIFFPDTAPYGTVTQAHLNWTPPGQSQAPATGTFTARYTTSTTTRPQVNVQQPQHIAAFGSSVAVGTSVTGSAPMPPNTAIAAYTGTITGPRGVPNPIAFHLLSDAGVLMSWVILDPQGHQVGGSNGWQSVQNGEADWTCVLTPGQSYTLTVQVMASAARGSFTCAPLTRVQVTWDTTGPRVPVPPSQTNGVTAVYATAAPWPSSAAVVQTRTTLVPAPACNAADGSLPAGVFQAEYQATLLVTTAGTYTFSVDTDANATIQLTIGTKSYGPIVAPSSGECQFPCDLAAGEAYALDLFILAPGASPNAPGPNQPPLSGAVLSWCSTSQLKAVVPGAQLIPATILSTFGDLYTVLCKIAVLVTRHRLTADEIVYFSVNNAQFGGFDLDLITPTGGATQVTKLMAMWQRVNAFATLRSSLPQSQTSLLDVFALATASTSPLINSNATPPALTDLGTAVAAQVAAATGWDAQMVSSLILHLNLSSISSFTNDAVLTRLQTCLQQVSTLGISPAKLTQWATNALQGTLGEAEAEDIKRTIKARYDDAAWTGVAHPLADALRERQRDALVAYILGLGTWNGLAVNGVPVTDTNLLYEYLLIDTEMSPCMLTSRIVQATAAVQLFVQRCQLGLEVAYVDPQAMDDELWSWMKLYRVWQANRKVFLWPENYIVESLRDDKTPFYKEFESELLQGQLTDDRIESAVSDYVAKLNQVANLEMCGLFWEQTDVDILHVFGRTRNTPHIYFYRRLENQTSWTPWERVDLDIEGDHLIPVIWNRRLYLFWPRFTMKTLGADPEHSTEQLTYWEITLAWSEYKHGKWQRKEVSKEILYFYQVRYPYNEDDPELRPWQSDTSPPISGQIYGGPWPYTIKGDVSQNYPPGRFTYRIGVSTEGTLGIAMFVENGEATDTTGKVHSWADVCGTFVFNGQSGHIDVILALGSWIVPYETAILDPIGMQVAGMTFVWDPTSDVAKHRNPQGKLAAYYVNDPANFNTWQTEQLLEAASGKYDLLPPAASFQFVAGQPFFYQDATRAYLCLPGPTIPYYPFPIPTERFSHLFHPYASKFVGDLSRGGIAALLTLSNQQLSEAGWDFTHLTLNPYTNDIFGNYFYSSYLPGLVVVPTFSYERALPYEQVDFDMAKVDSPYVMYNWELFFHVPFRLAAFLSQNRSFDAAETMFRYIFDITKSPSYWQVLPFTSVNAQAEQIQNLLQSLDPPGQQSSSVQDQIDAMQKHPFEPHLLARMRLSAYMKAVVFQYIAHHLAWGDQLYRMAEQASDREFLNEALQHYILVAQLLGPRPVTVPTPEKTKPQNYQQLQQAGLDLFSNTLVAFENEFPFIPTAPDGQGGTSGTAVAANIFYFCIPQNDQLLGYWDTVEDRLFKIRHCMTIDGEALQLPLFAPPINPMLLVQAAAQGIDLGSVLNDVYAPLPYYRFSYILQKAVELCADVRAFGAALLSALEKKDAEALAALRASREKAILQAMMDVKQAQLDEANLSLAALNGTRHVTEARFAQYQQWLGSQSVTIPPVDKASDSSEGSPPGQKYIPHETEHLDQLSQAQQLQELASGYEVASSVANYFPTYTQGAGPPTVSFGGSNVGAALYAFARFINAFAAQRTYLGTVASIKGAFDRRDDEWRLQLTLATRELEQIDQQMAAANKRVDIAGKEIENQQKQIDNAQEIEDFLRDKFTNQDLYDWMQGQLSTLYYQAYSMAYDLAKQAERAYRFERGLSDSNYIQFGYWDSVHQGLMAGEQLHLALRQLERAYQDQNKRDYEITKHISLALVDPLALVMLKETGVCEVELPEALFDADYPGHYMRRIKSMAITIPCVVGPYTSINCTLTLLSNITRISSDATAPYAEGDNDARFVYNFASVQSIATSHGQNDAGLFELNFRDERYLPFEGAGAVSRWRIELPRETNAFDFNTITDVILRLQYTARDGGVPLRKAASDSLAGDVNATSGARLFSTKHEFAAAWVQFLNPTDPNTATLQLDLSKDRFSYQLRGKTVQIQTVNLYLFLDELVDLSQVQSLSFTLTSPDQTLLQSEFKLPVSHPVMSASVPISTSGDNRGSWSLSLTRQSIPQALASDGPPNTLDAKKVRDLLIVCEYAIS